MGALDGIKIIEIAGIGPGPFAGMLLADMGADVIRVERPGGGQFSQGADTRLDVLNRNKRCICIDLKNSQGVATALQLISNADAAFEGFRPGVMEKLGLGPDVCLAANRKLVYGRMTGWGQDGPMAKAAGHDINYISIAGALHPIGRAGEKPAIPLNLVGDFGGGGLFLAYGMVCALLEAQRSGEGQVVDAAMVDGAATLMCSMFAAFQSGFWKDERGVNMLDSGAWFYDTYETSDGKYVSIGSLEPQFYAELLRLLELDGDALPEQYDMSQWPAMKARMEDTFKQKTRDEWCEIMEGSDVCFAPVLSMAEVKDHPHNRARNTFPENNGVWQPHPAPRFSRTDGEIRMPAAALGQHTDEVLQEYGFESGQIASLRESQAVA